MSVSLCWNFDEIAMDIFDLGFARAECKLCERECCKGGRKREKVYANSPACEPANREPIVWFLTIGSQFTLRNHSRSQHNSAKKGNTRGTLTPLPHLPTHHHSYSHASLSFLLVFS